ncbi:MAG TPA: hypothetical protein VM871_04620 [Flavisolibacter sp.]|nr:hypothetical protein [Flavisolibacter sp.]
MAQITNTDEGRPTGNRPLQGTGIPTKVNDANMPNDERLTEAYTRDDEEVKENVREMNPNRNTDKGKEVGTGGH